MKKAIVATKVGMTQIFNEDGVLTPVTVLQAGPVYVSQIKTVENDGYEAVQVAYGDVREKLVNKPVKGHLEKAGIENKRFLTEFKFENAAEYELGQEIKADIFEAGDKIDVTAKTKGKGFQGAISVMDSLADQWVTVPNSIDMLVPTVRHPIRVKYSKARKCLVRWVQYRLPFRILRLSA